MGGGRNEEKERDLDGDSQRGKEEKRRDRKTFKK